MGFNCIGFKDRTGLKFLPGPTLFAINAGLMKPRKGFARVGQKPGLGWARPFEGLTYFFKG